MAVASNFPAIRPSLNLDFANAKALDPRITFSRASAATYYDGKTVAKAEENLLARSQEFDAASWNKTRISVAANATTAPDGTVTADFISQVAGQTDSGVVDQLPIMPNDVVTFSIYAKAEAKTFIVLRLAGLNTWFNLSAGVVATVDLGITASIAPLGNGWYRCVVSKNAFGFNQAAVRPADFDNSVTVTDSGGIYIWGAQLEQRSQVTAYTPTTTQPITNYIPVLQTAPAGVPRFDHNPVTGESLGLLVEEQRTNLLLRSQDFITANWLGTGSGVAVSCIAPDGSLSGHKLFEDLTSGVHYRYQGLANVSGTTTYTLSAYVKAAGRSRVQLWSASGSPRFSARFDLASKTATGLPNVGGAVLLASTIEAVGNDWFRVSITGTTGTDNILGLHLFLDNGSNHFYQGDGYSGIYIWGAQTELGAFPTSYIKTEASQVTRAADSAQMTGANFSSWFNQNEGTMSSLAVCKGIGSNGASVAFSATDGTINNRFRCGYHGGPVGSIPTAISCDIATTAASQFSAAATYTQGFVSSTLAYARNNSGASFNASPVVPDTDCVIPSVTRMQIGNADTGRELNGHIKRITYYPKRLSDAQLQALTA